YTWSPATGMDNFNINNPVLLLGAQYDTITYHLKVSTPEGCSAADDIKITVYKTMPDIFIPTAFTPNTDRLNDILIPRVAGMKQFNYFRVYNRWGVMLYSTTQQGQGWDGTYAGSAQPGGTYVFAAQAVDYTGKVITKKGTVVLIR
ncbi:MAG TPA: gliding motility-associated C-terminal domain-containing protein, partial [Panacibacter sp.]|nr:gliding motility-associated C-terminal domain-containing protein [Panacibacter sp.]